MPFRFDRTFVFDRAPADLWAVLARTGDYPRWWPWLRRIDAEGLVEGTTARCLIRAPIPWPLHLDLHIERVVPCSVVEVRAERDLTGTASLDIEPHPDGSSLRLRWELEPQGILGTVGALGRPLLQWGQDWVVRSGIRQFRQRALA